MGRGASGLVLVLALASLGCGSSEPSGGNSGARQAASATPAPAGSPKPSFAHFGSGTKIVGTDIKPGTYRTRHGSGGCYFARLHGFSGGIDDIVANGNADDPVVVAIAASDKGFQSERCDEWTADL